MYKSPLAAHRLPMQGFTARNTLLSGSHRASTGVFPSVHGVSGPETGCMPYPSHGVSRVNQILVRWVPIGRGLITHTGSPTLNFCAVELRADF